MFTGLIEEMGVVNRLERSGEGGRLSIQARAVLQGTRLGDSVAVSGACLTVVELAADGFTVDCMRETLSHTTLGHARKGTRVNLERSLALGERLGGHLVLGHVDAVAEVISVHRGGGAWEVAITLPEEVRACVAPKGSVALDGISLTVMAVEQDLFRVGIIPHTLGATTLKDVKIGMKVNVEADVLARYVVRTVQTLGPAAFAESAAGITEEFLREQGFA